MLRIIENFISIIFAVSILPDFPDSTSFERKFWRIDLNLRLPINFLRTASLRFMKCIEWSSLSTRWHVRLITRLLLLVVINFPLQCVLMNCKNFHWTHQQSMSRDELTSSIDLSMKFSKFQQFDSFKDKASHKCFTKLQVRILLKWKTQHGQSWHLKVKTDRRFRIFST